MNTLKVASVSFAPLVYLLGVFAINITPILLRAVLKAIGIGFLTYVGTQVAFSAAEAYVVDSFAGMSGPIVAYASIAKIDVAASMLMSAISARIALNVFCGGMSRQLSFGFPRDC